MFDTRAVAQSFSRAAAMYDGQAQLQQRVRTECIALARWAQGARILDAGCGTGALSRETKHLGWEIAGLDLAPGMCRQVRNHALAVNADAASMPFAGASFDGVFSSLMLQWANEPLLMLREMKRVLQTGGRCVISTLAKGTLNELSQAFAAIDETPHVSRFLPAEQLKAMAAEAGFAIVSAQQSTIVEHYHDVISLMRTLKNIGAANRQANRRKGLMTPFQLRRLTEAYEKYATPAGYPASWRVLYLVLEA